MPTARDRTEATARRTERSLAPDLARGAMLLLIVLSNTSYYLWRGFGESALDGFVRSAMAVVLDLRIYPMFAFLIGYGMVQIHNRRPDERGAISLLRRRGAWMIVFGLAHAALLMSTDVLGTWGLFTLVLAGLFLRRSDRTVLTWCGIGVAYLTLVLVVLTVVRFAVGDLDVTAGTDSAVALSGSGEPGYLASVLVRTMSWPGVTAATLLLGTAPIAILLGIWAARHRVLEEPGRHLRKLRWTASAGVAIGWTGGLPPALGDSPDAVIVWLQSMTGLPCGVGYAAAFGLIAHAVSRRPRPAFPVVALAAVGKRSLSCYLTHSVIFAPVLAAWGLGLGGHLTQAGMALFACGVWLVTVAGAYTLERGGRRGPAEIALRHLIHRPAAKRASS
ncbi:DUF418 domain-containing protein [Nonomuraea mesophila]|uniref:DUF418 domain-containing protein n=1 Tax=Nonomuraea mesophila TaxID=2530382 RepID=A0A4R5F6A8_9ACTN|nr:DUF418 domain-containing protein [Nonomuraea mesophila]TDE42843.1 DUF418 domain-containing protein [Nonomuraea mesophila]